MSRHHRLIVWCLHFLFCCFYSRISSSDGDRISIIFARGEAVNPSPDFSPSAYSYRHRTKDCSNDNPEEIDLGTTLVAIKCSGGVIVGADTRTSVGGYVSNKFAYKINPIFEHEPEDDTIEDRDDKENDKYIDDHHLSETTSSSSCVLCRSGSAADTQWLAKQAKRRFRVRRLERLGYRPSISEVAHYLRYQMRNLSVQGGGSFQASLICAGYDDGRKGGQIFGITPGGSLWEEDNFCVSGSGSTVLLGYLDDMLQNTTKKSLSSDLTEKEAITLVTKLLRLSIARDGSSGGLVRLYVINRNGLEERTIYPLVDALTASSGSSTAASSIIKESAYTDLKGFATPSHR